MKALMYNGIGRLDYEDAPDPEGDFIVKVSGCGVCGTDLKAFLNGHPHFKPPTILGHEFHGVVARAPAGHRFAAGDAVVVARITSAGSAGTAGRKSGAVLEQGVCLFGRLLRIRVRAREYDKGVFPIPRDIAGTDAADVFTLVEPLACVLNGADRLRIRPTSRVLVAGGGPMGSFSPCNTSVRKSRHGGRAQRGRRTGYGHVVSIAWSRERPTRRNTTTSSWRSTRPSWSPTTSVPSGTAARSWPSAASGKGRPSTSIRTRSTIGKSL